MPALFEARCGPVLSQASGEAGAADPRLCSYGGKTGAPMAGAVARRKAVQVHSSGNVVQSANALCRDIPLLKLAAWSPDCEQTIYMYRRGPVPVKLMPSSPCQINERRPIAF